MSIKQTMSTSSKPQTVLLLDSSNFAKVQCLLKDTGYSFRDPLHNFWHKFT